MTGRPAGKTRRGLARWLLLPLMALVVVACFAGGIMLVISGSKSDPPRAAPLPAGQFSIKPGSLGKLPPLPPGKVTATDKSCSIPVTRSHLVIASLCINAPVALAYQQRDGTLMVPPDVHEIGLWNGGAQLTGPDGKPLRLGTTLLAGHVDYAGQGTGALYDLYRVRPGAVVYASGASGLVTRWRVTGLAVVPKSELPPWVVAGPTGLRKLVIVTCGGPVQYVPGYGYSYLDNVIATAIPA